MNNKKSICVIITASMNLHSLYRDHFLFLLDNDFEVTAIASPGPEHNWIKEMGIKTIEIEMERKPSPIKDIISLVKLIIFLSVNRFDTLVVSTPKASLLGMLAGKITFQKYIIYMIRGRAYENFTGINKKLYEKIDKLICTLSHKVLSISSELMSSYIEESICPQSKISLISKGSSNGVDLTKFTVENVSLNEIEKLKNKLNMEVEDIVLVYGGRLRKDKGTDELIKSFLLLQEMSSKPIKLLLVGEYEVFDVVSPFTKSEIAKNKNIMLVGWQKNVELFFAISHICVFPSHREGFGNVAIEASAMKLPVVGYDVVGLRESVEKNRTGILVKKGCVDSLANAIFSLITDEKLRFEMGREGRKRVELFFDSKVVWARLIEFYRESK